MLLVGTWALATSVALLAAVMLTRHLNQTLAHELEEAPLPGSVPAPLPLSPLVLSLSFTSIAALLVWLRGPSPLLLQDGILLVTLTGLAWLDSKVLLIEMRLLLLGALLQVSWLIAFAPHLLPDRILALLVGAGGLYWVGVVYETLRGREGLGSGDGAVLGLLGLWSGSLGLPVILFLAALLGALWGGWQGLRTGQEALSRPFPFAPFLCLAGASVYLAEQACRCVLIEALLI